MAITISLVDASPNRLRYLVVWATGGADDGDITSTGAASPDLLTDSLAGPLKTLAKAPDDGYGDAGPGALVQSQARALWLSDRATDNPAPGDPSGVSSLLTTALCKITPRTSVTALWTVDADVDGNGIPLLTVTMQDSEDAAASCYLDVEVPQAIG